MSLFYDLIKIPKKLGKEQVLKYINKYVIPNYPKENTAVIENLALDLIQDVTPIEYGITINKCIVKSFPTFEVFKKNSIDIFNRLNQTALYINTSVIILHKSKDNKWLFIISEIYIGWIPTDKVKVVDFLTFKENLQKESYITIIEPLIIYKDYYLDMGSKLKYDGNIYVYTMNGEEKIEIDSKHYIVGHLKFTKENIFNQAIKYLDFPYNLGDDLDKIDCSAFIRNVFLSCGKSLPRNTYDIKEYLSYDENFIVNDTNIEILHFNGHIALYLFSDRKSHYYIHANSRNMRVTIDSLGPFYLDFKNIIGISHLKSDNI